MEPAARKGKEMRFSGRKANVWLRHQNEGEDGYGAVLFTWPFIPLYVEKNVSSTNGHRNALSGSRQPAGFGGRSHLFGEVFRSDAERYVCHSRRFCFFWPRLSQLLKERVTQSMSIRVIFFKMSVIECKTIAEVTRAVFRGFCDNVCLAQI